MPNSSTRNRNLFISAFILIIIFMNAAGLSAKEPNRNDLRDESVATLKKAIEYFQSISIRGGYVYFYTLDMKEKWGEGKTDDYTIEVQPPGTPAVGMSFLRAYQATGVKEFIIAAEEAGNALIEGQNSLGGWEHKIHFNRLESKAVSFDDNQTQSAISFLMALDQHLDTKELDTAVDNALNMMLKSQLENGGWPHRYPIQGNYHDFATFNDNGINDCIRVMLEAHRYYKTDAFQESIHKVGRFMMISQIPPPQPGWAQQYNAYLQPAWARTFEPPAVCPAVTIRNIHTLIDLYQYTSSEQYLEPIPDALTWLKESRMPNGKWGRFLEIGTNKPLYYDRGRIRVPTMSDLHIERRTGYGYESDLSLVLAAAEERFDMVKNDIIQKGPNKPVPSRTPAKSKSLDQLTREVQEIIQSLDASGRWITKNSKYRKMNPGVRWNGEYEIKDRISSSTFNYNVKILCEYIERLTSRK